MAHYPPPLTEIKVFDYNNFNADRSSIFRPTIRSQDMPWYRTGSLSLTQGTLYQIMGVATDDPSLRFYEGVYQVAMKARLPNTTLQSGWIMSTARSSVDVRGPVNLFADGYFYGVGDPAGSSYFSSTAEGNAVTQDDVIAGTCQLIRAPLGVYIYNNTGSTVTGSFTILRFA